jgi:hypothetical protein
MRTKPNIWFFLLPLLLGSCQKEDIPAPGQVDAELASYLEDFIIEGEARGYQPVIDPGILDIRFDTLTGAVTGQCLTYSDGRREIKVSTSFWANAAAFDKEFLLFHELGHCLLDREHLDTQRADGTCLSMMHSGQGRCRNTYGASTRTRYLDELFQAD